MINNRRIQNGYTLVEIMIVVAIISILSAIAIPFLLKVKIDGNDTSAKTTLRTMSTVSEQYSSKNSGQYPTDFSDLTTGSTPYIGYDYCDETIAGYTYTCTNALDAYTYVATPVSIDKTGTTTYTIVTGGLLTPVDF